MSDPEERTVVRCYDEVHRIHGGLGKKSLVALAISSAFFGLGWLLDAEWPGFVGLVIVAGTIVIPYIVRVHRVYLRQICPGCGEQVGRYETSKSRIVLVCGHCGKRTPTDCGNYAGGKPTRMDCDRESLGGGISVR